jgi:WhiB family redox-sensing transcriptional regulator
VSSRPWVAFSPGAAGPLLAAEVIVPLGGALPSPSSAALSWQDRALCPQTDPESFFPEKGGSTREAKRVCRSCEVKAECLDYALANDERFGVWGGMSERERRRVARAASAGDQPAERRCMRGLHVMAGGNLTGSGSCRACKSAAERARRIRGAPQPAPRDPRTRAPRAEIAARAA